MCDVVQAKKKTLIASDIRSTIGQTCIYMLVMHISIRFSCIQTYSGSTKLLK